MAGSSVLGQNGLADLDFSSDADTLVLSLNYQHELLAENDLIPRLRIYGDERVLVH